MYSIMQNIRIIVNGMDLVLRGDTTLSMELNNALFAEDAIEGDVVYQFAVPVQGNEVTLGMSHLPYVRNSRRFDCRVLIGGVNMISGRLVVQDVTATDFEVAVLFNPYPDGFGDKMLSSCESEEVVICEDRRQHQTKWKDFLKESLAEGSDVKFAPFINEEAYGDDNAGFGLYLGASKEKMVNRLFFTENYDGTPRVVTIRARDPYVNLFCERKVWTEGDTTLTEKNQFCFCPQVRVRKALELLAGESGYQLVDHIAGEAKRAFLQSPMALDGNAFQYKVNNVRMRAWCGNDDRYSARYVGCCNDDDMLVEGEDGGVIFPYSGTYLVEIDAMFFSAYNGGLAFMVVRSEDKSAPAREDAVFFKDLGIRVENQRNKDYTCEGKKPYKVHTTFEVTIPSTDAGELMFVGLYNLQEFGKKPYKYGRIRYSMTNSSYMNTGAMLTVESLSLKDEAGLNIFARKFKWADLMPKVSVSSFLITMMRTLGLCYFVDNKSRQVELLSLPEMMKAGSLDLSGFVLTRETELAMPEMKEYGVSLDTAVSEDMKATDEHIADVDNFWQLPDPSKNLNKKAFVRSLNSYFAAVQVEDKVENWRVEWKLCGGNTRKVTVGSGEESEKKLDAVIPCMENRLFNVVRKGVHIANMNIPFRVQSNIYPAEETSEKVILVYYRGAVKYPSPERPGAVWMEDMRPVVPGEFSLTTTGENSLGEKYIKPWMKLNYTARTVTYKLRVPVLKALEIMRLIQPQRELPANQVRFVMVDNVKSVPKKISFEASVTSDMLLCEIEAATLE